MEQNPSSSSIANDVLHNPDHSKLTPEEIAKALKHHNKRHTEEPEANPAAEPAQRKKKAEAKPK